MKKIVWKISLYFLLPVFLLAIFVFQLNPLLIQESQLNTANASLAREKAKTILRQFSSSQTFVKIELNTDDIAVISEVASHTFDNTEVAIGFNRFGVAMASTSILRPLYLNLYCTISPDGAYYRFDGCYLGNLYIPGMIINAIMRIGSWLLFEAEVRETLGKLLSNVKVTDDKIALTTAVTVHHEEIANQVVLDEAKTYINSSLKDVAGRTASDEPTKTISDQPAVIIQPHNKETQVLFAEDIEKNIRQSEPNNINLPFGLQASLDIEYLGAFRVLAGGESGSDWAVGTLGFKRDSNSLFMAGHAHHNAIAEFKIPSELSFAPEVADINIAKVLQDYVKVLGKKEAGNTTNKINGILYHNQNLLVSSEISYDGNGSNRDNLQVFSNANNISSSDYKGMLQVEGAAKAAGYMFKVPAEMQDKIGSEYLIGWASNYNITSRYSQGPSLYRFDPNQAVLAMPTVSRVIDTEPLMVFPLKEGQQLVEGGQSYKLDISPIWGPVAKARYGFIIPGTSYFLAIGSHAGLHSGIGYKITQDSGGLCGGPCPYESADKYNYFWIFDVDDMLRAEQPWLVQPITYGKWSHPYDKNGRHIVIGGAFDNESSTLYLALSGAGQIGKYDKVPLIISYRVKAKQKHL